MSIVCKLGNMRKEVDWSIYPVTDPNLIMIQCDKRIARINMTTGKAMLSDGKGGHNGFMKLAPMFGAVEVDVSAEIVEELKQKTGQMEVDRIRQGLQPGQILLCGGHS